MRFEVFFAALGNGGIFAAGASVSDTSSTGRRILFYEMLERKRKSWTSSERSTSSVEVLDWGMVSSSMSAIFAALLTRVACNFALWESTPL